MITIYKWPDGFWCEEDELEYCLRSRSDDYETIELTWEAYEHFVNTH